MPCSRQNGREEIRRSFDTMPDLQLLHRARRIRVALSYCDTGKRLSRLIMSCSWSSKLRTNFSDTSKLARGGIVDTKPMQFEDAQLVSVGQSDSEYALGIGETMDDAPTMGMYAT
jgi:hypothetical protein